MPPKLCIVSQDGKVSVFSKIPAQLFVIPTVLRNFTNAKPVITYLNKKSTVTVVNLNSQIYLSNCLYFFYYLNTKN